jgi:hypothetical protein
MKKLKDKILYCLERHPDTRNSDIKLTSAIWYEYYREKLVTSPNGKLAVELVSLYELPNQDDVKRIRAKIQNKELKFLPTCPKIRQQRKIKEEEWRKFLGYNPELRTV